MATRRRSPPTDPVPCARSPRSATLLLAAALAAGGCGGDATGVMVRIAPEPGLALEGLQVEVVGRDASGGTFPLPARPYSAGSSGAAWSETLAVLAGTDYRAGADVLVIGLRGGLEVARGGAAVDFVEGKVAEVDVTLRAACRGVYCDARSYCGAAGVCAPAARRLDFTVNAAGSGDQITPAVAAIGELGWAVAWVDATISPLRVVLRRLGPDGEPLDAEDVAVEESALDQRDPALVGAPGAEAFVVAWAEAPDGRVRLRRYQPSGVALGGAEAPASTGAGEQLGPTLGANPAGFIVAWMDAEVSSGAGWSVRYRRGSWLASWVDMGLAYAATSPTSGEYVPAACGSCGGASTFLVAWQDSSGADPDPSGTQIRGRWLAGSPAAGGETVLNTTTAGEQRNPAAGSSPSLAAVAWEDRGSTPPAVRARLCRPSVTTVTPEITVATIGATLESARPAVAVAGETVLLVWEAEADGGQGDTVVLGRRLDGAGAFLDDAPFVVSTPRYGSQGRPRAAGSTDAFLIVWQELGGAGAAGWEVRGRVLGVNDAP